MMGLGNRKITNATGYGTNNLIHKLLDNRRNRDIVCIKTNFNNTSKD